MTVYRLFATPDGESHIEAMPQAFSTYGQTKGEPLQPARGVIFWHHPASHRSMGWHTVGRRQYVIVLKGEMELEASDGSKQRLHAGDAFLAEDTTGKGHITRIFGDRWAAVVPLLDEGRSADTGG